MAAGFDFSARRSTRVPKQTKRFDKSPWDCYNCFVANEVGKEAGDGSERTDATITVGNIARIGSSDDPNKKGHAEMAALYYLLEYWETHAQALSATDGFVQWIRKAKIKTVSCTAKPCCRKCSGVLGLLGFAAASDGTNKTRDSMDMTNWGLNPHLREVLQDEFGEGLEAAFRDMK